jgi:hypothetical protein
MANCDAFRTTFFFYVGVRVMRPLAILLAACGTLLTAQASFAQRDATSKISGEAYRVGSSAVYQQHAYENAQAIQYYSQQGKTVPKDTLKAHAAQVRQNLELSNKELAALEEKAKTDKTVAQHLTAIKELHAKAIEACGMVDECAEAGGDSTTVAKCCADMATHLKAAKAEHEKLQKYLKVSPIPKAK